MKYCKDCKHFQAGPYTTCGAYCLGKRGEFQGYDPIYGVDGKWSGKITPCSIARSKGEDCGPDAVLWVGRARWVEQMLRRLLHGCKRCWMPIRIWRQMVAWREWQDQLAICETADPEHQHLADAAEQRYRELCK